MVSRVVHDCMWPQCVRACGVCVCIVSTAVPVVDSLRAPRCQAVQPRREGRGGRLHARLGRRAASGARAWGGVSLRVGVVAVTMTAASSGVDWAAGSILRAGCISSSRPLCCYVSPVLPAAASQRCDRHRQCKTMPGQWDVNQQSEKGGSRYHSAIAARAFAWVP